MPRRFVFGIRSLCVLLSLASLATVARADWPAAGKRVGLAHDSFNGSYGVRFLELPSGDLGVLLFGTGGNAFGYSLQRIGRGGDLAAGWPTDGVALGEWGKSIPPTQHGFAVDDSGCVWHATQAQIAGRCAQMVTPDGILLPGWSAAWQTLTSGGSTPSFDVAPAEGGAFVLVGTRLQRMLRGGALAPGWPAAGVPVPTSFEGAVAADGAGGAVAFGPGLGGGPFAQRIDGDGVRNAGWSAAGLSLSSDPADLDADPTLICVDPLVPSGADGFIAGWARPFSSTHKSLKLQRFTRAGALDPAWPSGGVLAVSADSIAGVTLLPDGEGGAHVLWYSLSQNIARGTHVLASGEFAPGLGPLGVPLAAAGSQPHIPRRYLTSLLAYVVACPAPGGGLVFAWNDDAQAPVKSIRVRWLLPDYTADPAEPAEGRLILPQGEGCELRGIHPDGVGGAFVAWEQIAQVEPGPIVDVGEIWMTRLLPSALVGAPRPSPVSAQLDLSVPRPNPARGAVAADLTLPEGETALVELLDVAGRVFASRVVRGGGHRAVEFGEAASAPAGLYFIRARAPSGAVSRRVVLAH